MEQTTRDRGTITLVRGGFSDQGSSLWHIWGSQNAFMIYTMCLSEIHSDNAQIKSLAEYTGSRRLSMCSYCMKEFQR